MSMSVYTYVGRCLSKVLITLLDSYEGLPPNFTLGYNMLAGAFAGIAVGDPERRSSYMSELIVSRSILLCTLSIYLR